jgi:hypothetical protein
MGESSGSSIKMKAVPVKMTYRQDSSQKTFSRKDSEKSMQQAGYLKNTVSYITKYLN